MQKSNIDRESVTPDIALELLKAGNNRFLDNLTLERDVHVQIKKTSQGQKPFAVILGCIDSRVPAEMIFDQGIGDVFNIRIAGNFVNNDILGSMEFSCKIAGAKLILVLGHTKCGAISGALQGVELGNLTSMLNKLRPAVEYARQQYPDASADDTSLTRLVEEQNVRLSLKNIKDRSPVLREMINNSEIKLAAGIYDIDTGKVRFLD